MQKDDEITASELDDLLQVNGNSLVTLSCAVADNWAKCTVELLIGS